MDDRSRNWNRAEEKEIRLTELIWKILYAWRFMILCVVVCAVLLTGLKYGKDKSNLAAASAQNNLSEADLRENLTTDQENALTQAESVQRQLEEKQDYQAESILMNIDAYAKKVVTLQYYVNTNYTVNLNSSISMDYVDSLIDSYTAYIENKGLNGSVTETLDWSVDEVYVGELIKVGGRIKSDGDQTNTVNTSGKTFIVYVTGEDDDQIKELADAVEQAITAYQPVLSDTIGAHELTLVDRYESVVTDETLAASQASLQTSITDLETKLSTLTAAFTDVQQKLLDGNTAEKSSTETASSAGISKKYILFGAFIGLFLGCLWIVLRYILSGRIQSAEELQEMYGLRILGNLAAEEKKRRFLDGFDRWLDAIRCIETWTVEEQQELILTNIVVTCKKEKIGHVFFTTSVHVDETEDKITKVISEKLRENGIQVTFGENIMRNAGAFEQMAEIGHVVILEKAGTTQYTVLEKELTACSEQGALLLGIIVMN